MHRAGIVPDYEIADLPAMAIAKLGPHAMRVKLGDQVERFVLRHALPVLKYDADAFASSDIERLAPGMGMGAHDRVGDIGCLGELRRGQLRARAVVDAPPRRVAMDRPQPGEPALH